MHPRSQVWCKFVGEKEEVKVNPAKKGTEWLFLALAPTDEQVANALGADNEGEESEEEGEESEEEGDESEEEGEQSEEEDEQSDEEA